MKSKLRVAYFVNQYPKVSHAFIRREILALEQQGVDVLRIALRGWIDELVDAADLTERTRTRYVLQGGVIPVLWAMLCVALRYPVRFARALALAVRMVRQSEKGWIYHIFYLAEACHILPWVKAFGARHIHAHFGTNSAEVVMLVTTLGGTPYSFTVHGPEEFDKPVAIGLSEKIHHARFVVAISSYGRSQLYRWCANDQWHKIKVVRCGIEPAFHQGVDVSVPDTPRFVCVGRLCEQKGQLLLVEAAACLQAKGVDFSLVLAGDGEMRSQIESAIQRHQLQDKVRITGWISSDQVRAEILAARAMVLPSFAEGLPVVLMEAMALRRPVISTFVAGIPELVLHGVTGWLCPAGSTNSLVEAMSQCIEASSQTIANMGHSGYERVKALHGIDKAAARLKELISASEVGMT